MNTLDTYCNLGKAIESRLASTYGRAASMERFPDGAHVRLRSLVRRKYLHADEDGTGVFLSPVRASQYAAWRVHRVVRNDVPFVLLHCAAFGRYLAATDEPAPPGHRGQLVVQGMYDHPDENDVVWTVDEAEGGYGVLLHHVSGRLLRANGRRRTWNNGVSVDHPGNRSTMMHWVVEPLKSLQLRLQTPCLLPPGPDVSSPSHRFGAACIVLRSSLVQERPNQSSDCIPLGAILDPQFFLPKSRPMFLTLFSLKFGLLLTSPAMLFLAD
jgi:hypothetical protein